MYCNLFENCHTPRMSPQGDNKKRILVVGDAPGEIDDKEGEHFMGSSGQYLRRTLRKLGIDLNADCRLTYALRCRPKKGRKPEAHEIEACRQFLLEEIKLSEPSLILVLGMTAMEALYGHRMNDLGGGMQKWRGFVFPDRQWDCWTAPLMDPAYVLKMGGEKDITNVIFKQDMENALQYAGVSIPSYLGDELDYCEVLNEAEACSRMKDLLRQPKWEIAFDYETNALKPELPKAEIISCSICTGWFSSYAFMMTPETTKMLSAILRVGDIQKIASNLKFEQRWSKRILGHGVEGWSWDTMQAQHILDNRPGITSIKFVSAILLGLWDYEDYIQAYIKGPSNGYNRMRDADQHKLLEYNAMDSLLEYRAAYIQRRFFKNPEGLDWRLFDV